MSFKSFFAITLAFVACLFAYNLFKANNPQVIKTDYNVFLTFLQGSNVAEVAVQENGTYISYRLSKDENDALYVTQSPYSNNDKLVETLLFKNIPVQVIPQPKDNGLFISVLIGIIPVLLLIGFFIYQGKKMEQGGGAAKFGTNKSRVIMPGENKVKLTDVAGNDAEFNEAKEIIDFIKNPDVYLNAKAKFPKGILLSGPPGTGKTLLAKAIAGEAFVPFYSVSGSEFIEMFVGVGASRVRSLFEEARKNSPAIIFIDELDSIGGKRGNNVTGGGKEHDQTLNQLLIELDGVEEIPNILVLAATNRLDMLDPALTRPGRFDRVIHFGLPDLKSREEILKVHAKNFNLDENISLENIAKGTTGFSGAELASVLNEAAIFAAREKRTVISNIDLEKAKDKVLMGPENPKKMDAEEIKITAYHECGHTIVGMLMPDHDPIHKVSIIPRGYALGITSFLPDKESYSQSKQKLNSLLCTLLAGRVAEELIFGKDKITTGASSDIERATTIAKNMVTKWGLSDLGPIHFNDQKNLGDFSEETANKIDNEIERIILDNYQRTKDILTKNTEKLHKMAALLIEKETLDKQVLTEIMNG